MADEKLSYLGPSLGGAAIANCWVTVSDSQIGEKEIWVNMGLFVFVVALPGPARTPVRSTHVDRC